MRILKLTHVKPPVTRKKTLSHFQLEASQHSSMTWRARPKVRVQAVQPSRSPGPNEEVNKPGPEVNGKPGSFAFRRHVQFTDCYTHFDNALKLPSHNLMKMTPMVRHPRFSHWKLEGYVSDALRRPVARGTNDNPLCAATNTSIVLLKTYILPSPWVTRSHPASPLPPRDCEQARARPAKRTTGSMEHLRQLVWLSDIQPSWSQKSTRTGDPLF